MYRDIRRHGAPALLLFGATIAAAPQAHADRVYLDNGDRLSGTVRSLDETALVMEPDFGGTVRIPRGRITAVSTDDLVTVTFTGQKTATGRLERSADRGMRLAASDADERPPFDIADTVAIQPGVPINPRPGLRWEGLVNLGAGIWTGNSEKHNVHFQGETVGRNENHRISAGMEFDWSKARRADAVIRGLGSVKYDRFLSPTWYLYLAGSAERNDRKRLNLRSWVGPGVGYQVVDSPTVRLQLETGTGYVHEDFDDRDSQSSIGMRWAFGYEHRIDFGGYQPNFFHNHELAADVGGEGDILLRSRTGIRMPLRDRLHATTQVNLDWHDRPAAEARARDVVYLLTLGFSW